MRSTSRSAPAARAASLASVEAVASTRLAALARAPRSAMADMAAMVEAPLGVPRPAPRSAGHAGDGEPLDVLGVAAGRHHDREAGSDAPDHDTVVCHGEPSPPAGQHGASPIGAPDDGWRTCTTRHSSTPVTVPPTVAGDETAVP